MNIKEEDGRLDCSQVRMAEGVVVNVQKQDIFSFKLAHQNFKETFLVLPTTNSIILGNLFFQKAQYDYMPSPLLQLNNLIVHI